jgi:regulator of cell morphogenesis and NO signaling
MSAVFQENLQEKTVGQWVVEQPALSKVFEQFGIDYCCGGKKPLAQACQEKGLNYGEVLASLQQAQTTGAELDTAENLDWSQASITDTVMHIVEAHHGYVYEAMPRLLRLVEKVARVHGERNPKLIELQKSAHVLFDELIPHMQKEEEVLFPLFRHMDILNKKPQWPCGHEGGPITVMLAEHEQTGADLARLRDAADDYEPPIWACNTYRAMLDGLRELEADIHRHIHEENNILFPKVQAFMEGLQ